MRFAGRLALVLALSLLGKIVGFARFAALGREAGATAEMDALLVVLNLCLFWDVVIISGAIVPTLVPRSIQGLQQDGFEAATATVGGTAWLLIASSAAYALILFSFGEWIAAVISPGLSEAARAHFRDYLDWAALYPVMIAVLAFSSLCNRIYEARPWFSGNLVLINGASLAGILIGAGAGTLEGFFAGMVAGCAVAAIVQALVARGDARELLRRCRVFAFKNSPLAWFRNGAPVLLSALPLAGTVLVQELNLYVDIAFASLLGEGNIAALGYAERLVNVLFGLLIVGAFALLQPRWARMLFGDNPDEGTARVSRDLGTLLVVAFAISVLMLVGGPTLSRLVYGDMASVDAGLRAQVDATVAILGLALLPKAAALAFARLITSLRCNRYLVVVAVVTLCTNTILNYLLAPRFGLVGIAYATLCSFSVQALLLLFILHRRGHAGLVGGARGAGRVVLIWSAVGAVGYAADMPEAPPVLRLLVMGFCVAVASAAGIVLFGLSSPFPPMDLRRIATAGARKIRGMGPPRRRPLATIPDEEAGQDRKQE